MNPSYPIFLKERIFILRGARFTWGMIGIKIDLSPVKTEGCIRKLLSVSLGLLLTASVFPQEFIHNPAKPLDPEPGRVIRTSANRPGSFSRPGGNGRRR